MSYDHVFYRAFFRMIENEDPNLLLDNIKFASELYEWYLAKAAVDEYKEIMQYVFDKFDQIRRKRCELEVKYGVWGWKNRLRESKRTWSGLATC